MLYRVGRVAGYLLAVFEGSPYLLHLKGITTYVHVTVVRILQAERHRSTEEVKGKDWRVELDSEKMKRSRYM